MDRIALRKFYVVEALSECTYRAIGEPFKDMTISSFLIVLKPGVADVTFLGSNFGVAITKEACGCAGVANEV